VEEIPDNLDSYLQNKLEYYKLYLFKKMTLSMVSFFRILFLGGIALLMLFFLSFAAAYLIGEALENFGYGFLIIAGVYVLIFLFAMVFGRKFVERKVLRSTSKVFFND
jgi:sterol desaturase/sphingolipid hydroxylase (fatty acid hydroxylase superfamily)